MKIKAFRLCGSAVVWVLWSVCGAGSGRGADAVPPCHAVTCVGLLRALCGAFLAVGGLLHPPTVCGAVWASVGDVGASSISICICAYPVPLSCPVAALCAL